MSSAFIPCSLVRVRISPDTTAVSITYAHYLLGSRLNGCSFSMYYVVIRDEATSDAFLQVGIVIGTPDAIFLSVQIKRMGCGLQMRTFDMVAVAYLGDLTIEQPQYKSLVPGRDTLFVIDNAHSSDQNLLQLKYVQVRVLQFAVRTTFRHGFLRGREMVVIRTVNEN